MSKFVVSARKYRPSTFDEVIGQNHIAKTLKNALQSQKLAHAFLFCGPRGVGKTTCARILAKVINCENPVDQVEPCNTCNSCKSFNDNASFNIIELDAASNNSVEHIRTLIEQVRFQPQQGTHKIFIIDEVHMLSSQAFNAFLKTLEEPPSYAIFILATTEKHKIIPTILSRCQIFDFKRIQVEDTVLQLQHICDKEEIKADPEALHLIGQKADGAMRDALSIFDKIASAAGKHITYKDVITNLNILDFDYYFKIVDAFLREDMSEVLMIVDEIIRAGFEAEQLVEGLSNHLRDLLICKDARTVSLLEVSDSLKAKYRHQASLSTKSMLLTGMDILNQCDIALPRSKNPRLYVEIALTKITFINRALDVSISPEASPEKKTKLVSDTNVNREIQDQKPINNHTGFEASIMVDSTVEKEEIRTVSPVVSTLSKPHEEEQIIGQSAPSTATPIEEKSTESPTSQDNSFLSNIKKPSDINSILEALEEEENELMIAQQDLNQAKVEEFWKEYASSHDSPSVKTVLNLAIVRLNDRMIDVIIPSNHYKNMILEEEELKEYLRKKLGTTDLIINPIVDKDSFPDLEIEKPKILMTNNEKMEMLAQKNSAFKELITRLDLKIDGGN